MRKKPKESSLYNNRKKMIILLNDVKHFIWADPAEKSCLHWIKIAKCLG